MYHFFAYLDRMKLIRRWGLMRNTVPETDMEHSMQTAFIAHGLAALGNTRHERTWNVERIVLMAMYHDASEVITGDLPTPVKYKTPEIQGAYRELEVHARQQLLDMLPEDLQSSFRPYVDADENSEEWKLVKAADRISAYLKCVEEEKMGNRDFAKAKTTIFEGLMASPLPEVRDFMREFIPSFILSTDELSTL